MNIEERMQDLEKQVNEITETAARLREQFEREQKQAVSGVPEMVQKYWYLNDLYEVKYSHWGSLPADKKRLAFGNVYLTEAEAIKARDQKLAEVKVITRLRELDGGFVADWGDENQNKYCVHFDHAQKGFFIDVCQVCQALPSHWTSTKEAWNQVIQEMESAVKLMIGVEVV